METKEKTVNEFIKECAAAFGEFTFVAQSIDGLVVRGQCFDGKIEIYKNEKDLKNE